MMAISVLTQPVLSSGRRIWYQFSFSDTRGKESSALAFKMIGESVEGSSLILARLSGSERSKVTVGVVGGGGVSSGVAEGEADVDGVSLMPVVV